MDNSEWRSAAAVDSAMMPRLPRGGSTAAVTAVDSAQRSDVQNILR